MCKNLQNCSNAPVLSQKNGLLILDVITLPQLHLMLGVLNKVYKHMLMDFEKESLQWAEMCNVHREFVHGAPAFAGNACRTLLKVPKNLKIFAVRIA